MGFKGRVIGLVSAAGAAALVVSGISPTAATSETPASAVWNLASDFPNPLVNPAPDSYGNTEVWTYMRGTPHSSAGYTQLPTPAAGACDNGQVDFWASPAEPWVAKNRGATGTNCGTPYLPAGAVGMNPHDSGSAIVRWKSPVSGKVAITGGVTDADAGGGDGIAWSIDKGDTVLASGAFLNGGSQTFANGTGGTSLGSVEIAAGESLYLSVSANGTFFYDVTIADFTITWIEAPTTTSTAPTTTSSSTTSSSTTSSTSSTTSSTTSTTIVGPPASPCAHPTLVVPDSRSGKIFYGTEGNDVILGSNGNDRIDARGGDDVICSLAGTDSVIGGTGNDTIFGGLGRDSLIGREGDDRIYGEEDKDSLRGDAGNDIIAGGVGDDALRGDAGNDALYGEAGRDQINGYDGDDVLFGGPDVDRLDGSRGYDYCSPPDKRNYSSHCESFSDTP